MYRKHFGLARHPFAKDLAVEDLFASTAVTELEVRLRHLLDLRGIGLVTGEPGGGKTTICRKVAASLHSGLYRVFYVPLSTGNVMDIYKSIAWELGLPTERSRAALYRVIRAEVTRLCLETKVRPILIVDDAQYLRSDVLEELRLLTNYEMDSQNRLCPCCPETRPAVILARLVAAAKLVQQMVARNEAAAAVHWLRRMCKAGGRSSAPA